jgi:elongation factor P
MAPGRPPNGSRFEVQVFLFLPGAETFSVSERKHQNTNGFAPRRARPPRVIRGAAAAMKYQRSETTMAIPASQIKVGNVIYYEDDLWIVVDTQHVKLSKGGGAMQTKLKNLKRGDHITNRFRSSDKVETAFLERRGCEYLYPEGEGFVFMDLENYEQYNLHSDLVGDQMKFVAHNSQVQITFHEGKPITVALPPAVELQVTETEPGARGDTVSNVYKPATLETGYVVKVPNHIRVEDRVKVSTETGEFLERVN